MQLGHFWSSAETLASANSAFSARPKGGLPYRKMASPGRSFAGSRLPGLRRWLLGHVALARRSRSASLVRGRSQRKRELRGRVVRDRNRCLCSAAHLLVHGLWLQRRPSARCQQRVSGILQSSLPAAALRNRADAKSSGGCPSAPRRNGHLYESLVLRFMRLKYERRILGKKQAGLEEGLSWAKSPYIDVQSLGVQTLGEIPDPQSVAALREIGAKTRNLGICIAVTNALFTIGAITDAENAKRTEECDKLKPTKPCLLQAGCNAGRADQAK